MKDMREALHWWKPATLMVGAQIVNASATVLFKLAINDGMSVWVGTAYRLAFAAAFTLPLALIFERNKRPRITWRLLFMGFLCGLFGQTLFINLFFGALALTSATLASAIGNLIPAITFIIAFSCGLEKLKLGAASGKAKVLGTIIGTGGAMVLTFYKGVEIDIWPFHINLLHPHQSHEGHLTPLQADTGSELLGVLCAFASYSSFSLWFIIQAKMNGEYPSQYSGTALMTAMGAIQSMAFALCVERDWSQWKLGWNIRLLTVAYSGIVVSGIVIMAMAWCIRVRGPLYVSVFYPLQLVAVAVAASLMLDENLYLGSVLGGVLIVCGLYMVLWGKSKEMQQMTDHMLVPSEITGDSEVSRSLLC